MKHILILTFLLSSLVTFGQGKPTYRIFNAKGKKVSYKKMLRQLKKKDILLFGEYHDNPITHWLQLEVTQDLHKKRKLILGAEMIETDNQEVLNQYLQGKIDKKGLDTLARLWGNHKTDYAPLVDFAKDKNLQFIATNIPRRYASRVYKKGGFPALDKLSQQEKEWVAPLPIEFDIELSQYKKMLDMMGGHGGEDIVKAQAIKDATMAHFILNNYVKRSLFIHYNGTYHSDYYEGILWYLKRKRTDLKYTTISTVYQKDIKKLLEEHKGKADFIICVPENMTRTF